MFYRNHINESVHLQLRYTSFVVRIILDVVSFAMVHNGQLLHHRNGIWLLLKRAVLALLSEAALKFHIFLYWLICLFSMMEEHQGLHTLRVMLVAMSIVFALLAMITGTACFFYPFLFVVIFEFVKSLAVFILLTLKLGWPERYATLVSDKGLDMLREFTKITLEEDEMLYLWNGFSCFYFAILAITLIRNIAEYQVNENRRQQNPYAFPAMAQYPHVVIFPAEAELGNTNPDDPPPYSAIARNGVHTEETAKEETQPPRYSDIELSSTSSQRMGGENDQEVLNRTIVIGRK
ncbi:hypothetical protein RB195_010990 [Necator americanus]|uniref:Uncharacterized protein n=1 Tax=Necator americanus TaxID=51031 RepID=A0ABR1D3M9_NECAM